MRNMIRFKAISKKDGEVVKGYYWENLGIGYIIDDNEEIQPPIKRTHEVFPETVEAFNVDEEEQSDSTNKKKMV